MSRGVKIEEYQFRSLLDNAVQFRSLMGGIQWYGPAPADSLPQANLLNGEFWYSAAEFHDALGIMWKYCQTNPDTHGLDHALIYVFDGRDGSIKFHAYLWKPETGDTMQPLDYGRAVAPLDRHYSYPGCILDALLDQKKAVKASTVVKRALPLAVKRFGTGASDETHTVLLHNALKTIMQTEPLIYSRDDLSPHSPTGRFTMVEHLGIYDKDATWLPK